MKLKRCPFCDSGARVYDTVDGVEIGCNDSTCMGYHERNMGWTTETSAIIAWNTRAKE